MAIKESITIKDVLEVLNRAVSEDHMADDGQREGDACWAL